MVDPTGHIQTHPVAMSEGNAVYHPPLSQSSEQRKKQQLSEIIPFVPFVNIVNNTKIAITGLDLMNYAYNDIEIQDARFFMVLDYRLPIIGAEIGGLNGTEINEAKSFADELATDSMKSLSEPLRLEDHHIIPKFRGKSKFYTEFIEKLGINVDDYTITVSGGKGGQHMNFIHGKAQWNLKWIDQHLNATEKDVFQFAGKMMDEYNLSGYRIHPYGK